MNPTTIAEGQAVTVVPQPGGGVQIVLCLNAEQVERLVTTAANGYRNPAAVSPISQQHVADDPPLPS